jgi:polyribonucleotide nucleotidyltransferase
MDLKVAGTAAGVTAIQMDARRGPVDFEVLAPALEAARKGRLAVLASMAGTLSEARSAPPPGVPRSRTCRIDPAAVGILIGPKGAHVRALEESCGVGVNVREDGHVTVTGPDDASLDAAERAVVDLAGTVEVGAVYEARVTGVKAFGAFVRIYESAQGLIPIGEWERARTESMEAVTRVGDAVPVRVLGVDERGRLRLSRRAAL